MGEKELKCIASCDQVQYTTAPFTEMGESLNHSVSITHSISSQTELASFAREAIVM